MPALSKLQIRAKVLSVVSELKRTREFDNYFLTGLISEFAEIEDKETLFSVFIKEYLKFDEDMCNLSSFILKETVPVSVMEPVIKKLLMQPSYSDEVKYKLVLLMRTAEIPRDINELAPYFEHPERILDKETQSMLKAAVFNPESMLDFLDFISAVSPQDRKILTGAMKKDYSGDELANILYPLIYSDFEDEFKKEIVEILSESKSSLAIAPLNYLINVSSNNSLVNTCKTGLKKLKLAGCTQEKAEEYFKQIIEDTVPGECFTTIPDGAGNQAFLVSRKDPFGKYLLMAVVINDTFGIADTFGFYKITADEFLKVAAKFYRSEGRYCISPEYAKFRIKTAIDKTTELKRPFPYEFICWAPLLSDISLSDNPTLEILENTDYKFDKEDIIGILAEEYTFRWYITESDDKHIDAALEEFYANTNKDINVLNDILKGKINAVFDEETTQIWKDRLLNLAYLLLNNNEEDKAHIFAYLLKNDEMFNIFKSIILQRSITNYIVKLTGNLKESFFPVNIFKKRDLSRSKYDAKELEKIIMLIRENWIVE